MGREDAHARTPLQETPNAENNDRLSISDSPSQPIRLQNRRNSTGSSRRRSNNGFLGRNSSTRAPAPPVSFSLSQSVLKTNATNPKINEAPKPGAYHTNTRPSGMNLVEWHMRQARARRNSAGGNSTWEPSSPGSRSVPGVERGNIMVIASNPSGRDNDDDDDDSISGGEEEYIAGPSISSPALNLQDHQEQQQPMVNQAANNFNEETSSYDDRLSPLVHVEAEDDSYARRNDADASIMDAGVFVRSDESTTEEEKGLMGMLSRRPGCMALVGAIMLLVVVGIVVAIVLSTSNKTTLSSSPTTNDTPVVNECDWIRLLEQCGPSANASSTRLETIPSCLAEPYEALRKDWMPHADPNFDEPSDSCQPQNLAVYGAAVVRNHSDVSLLNRYVLLTLFVSTNGLAWKKNDGWLSAQEEEEEAGAECSWYRVTCDSDNRVVALELRLNNLEGESIPSELGLLTTLEKLQLSRNFLGGSIPTELIALTKLTLLELGNCGLQTQIDTKIGLISNLVHLNLEFNALSGTLPSEVGLLTKMSHLALSHNQLLGTVPPEIGNMTGLQFLSLQSNFFTGVLPSEMGKLTLLAEVYFSDNAFTGMIPGEICDLWDMGALDQFGVLVSQFSIDPCNDGSYGGMRCPSLSCCRNCQDPPLARGLG